MTLADVLTQHGFLVPYLLGLIGLLLTFLFKDATIVQRHGLQIIAMAFFLPTLVFAANKSWISNDAFITILSAIVGYVFGSGAAAVSSRKDPAS